MLEDLIEIHREVLSTIERKAKRYLFSKINWNTHAACILGDRGVGKTTLMCQHLLETYKTSERALYISADNIHVTAQGLFNIAREYFAYGGEAIFIDEVHKYPNWSVEIKNILDTYKKYKIIFSGSSSLDLKKSKADLSRRVVYYHLFGLSFREYILLQKDISLPVLTFEEILKNHVAIAEELRPHKILKLFKNYLVYGYYPFFLEGIEDYAAKINNIIEKVIFEDITVVYNLKQTTIPTLKKLLWLVATTDGFIPNIDNISSSLGVSRDVVYNCIEYLGHAGLLANLYPAGGGMKLIRKPGKIYLNNSNLLYAINSTLKNESRVGGVRETFFFNQVSCRQKVNVHSNTDFLVDETYSFEVGGRNKHYSQIKDLDHPYLALDEIEVGFKNKIPLYLFGLLY